MNIDKLLNDNQIAFEYINDDITIACPFCNKSCLGEPMATLIINTDSYLASCSSCHKNTTWKEISEKLEIKGTNIIENETKETTIMPSDYSKIKIWNIGEIFEHDFGKEEWLVESLIPKQGIMALSGNPGDFKTWITIHIAICVSRGIPVFGKYKTMQGNILVIDEEDHLRTLKKRLELLGAEESDKINYISQGGIKMDNFENLNYISQYVKDNNIKLVILDSLVRLHQQDENDAKGMAKVFAGLQKIIVNGSSILFTHHHRKQQGNERVGGQSMRGSSDILAAVDSHMTVEKNKEEKDHLVLRQTKLRQAEPLPSFEINIIKNDSNPSDFEYVGNFDEKKKKVDEIIENIILILKDDKKSRPEIHEVLRESFGKSAIDESIKKAEENGDIQRVPKEELDQGERKAYYKIPTIDLGLL